LYTPLFSPIYNLCLRFTNEGFGSEACWQTTGAGMQGVGQAAHTCK
jgi:hypothetical protein